METININGKEYTESEFTNHCRKHNILLSAVCSWNFSELLGRFPRHEPEPPTVRPMSELPEKWAFFLLDQDGIRSWQDGYILDGVVLLDQGGTFKGENFTGTRGQILGWLPSLPNPNDIKL